VAQLDPGTNAESPAMCRAAEGNARTAGGVEAYRYDPRLRFDAQVGLERLRCVKDREIAGLLFKLYGYVERRELARSAATKPLVVKTQSERWRQIAIDALAGKRGAEAREFAEYLLKGDDGRDHLDEGSVRAFARGYEKLRVATLGEQNDANARRPARHRAG
jgi:hypothetical protein